MPKVQRRPAVDATIRLLKLLTLLPRAPKKISTRQLRDLLAADGMDVNLRSIQRDLTRLSAHFAITTDGAKPEAGWQWTKGAAELSVPGLDDRTALAWVFAGQYLDALLPEDIKETLKPRFEAARKVLAQTPFARTRRWAERVIAKPRGFQLLPPKVEPGVPEAVQRALLDRKRLRISYLQPSRDKPMEAEISVLGLVVRGSVTYPVALFWDYERPLHVAMHRIKRAILLDTPSREPSGFSLSQFVESGEMDWPVGPIRRVEFEVTADLARILLETPISNDQVIARVAHRGWVRIQATVAETMEFHAWLRAQGERLRRCRFSAAKRA